MKGSELDLIQLRKELKNLKRWHPLYKILRDELSILGYWKVKERGDVRKGYEKGFGKNR